ncbi:MAG: hypothetical protein EPN88_04835 [Bacteroidetes bacterium]|nr:MAG: hypothetical protein EPN88_04835 [Bacteroidota bacterium]
MKPLFKNVLFVILLSWIIISIGIFSCSKHEDPINAELKLREKQEIEMLAQISNLTYMESVPGASEDNYLINSNNPYETAGFTIEKASIKLFSNIKDKKTNPDSLKAIFISELESVLPESVLYPDSTDYIKFEETLESAMLNILSEEYNNFVSKSTQIENIIVSSDYLNDVQKKRVLIFSSVLRHGMGAAHQILTSGKGIVVTDGWEEFATCFVSKMRDLNGCTNCTIEKFLCKLYFVECYAVWAADCLISVVL